MREDAIMTIFRAEVSRTMGDAVWDKMAEGIDIPHIDTESQYKCSNMRELVRRFDEVANQKQAKEILSRVRHGLKPQAPAETKAKLEEFGDLDKFNEFQIEKGIADFKRHRDSGETWFGELITDEVIAFLKDNPETMGYTREGNRIFVMAFPANIGQYIKENDPLMKRYYACHCPYAKESILSGDPVSATLCNCSLGHVKNFWEGLFETELDGEVLESILKGDMRCRYSIHLPEYIYTRYCSKSLQK